MVADKSSSQNSSCGSKRTACEAFGNRLMEDVPECYNYGVFFDDGYDYMKHMKTMKEFFQDQNFIIEGEENDVVPKEYVTPIVEPVVMDDPVDEEFGIPTDDELISENGELEDDFVELAGGKHVIVDEDNDAIKPIHEAHNAKALPSTSNLPHHKVLLMERYLWGAQSVDLPSDDLYEVSNGNTSSVALRKGRHLTEGEDLLERQFNKLMQVTKSRNGLDNRSIMSGTSVMSENLESVVRADEVMISKRHPQNNDWECPDDSLKTATLHCLEEMAEPDDDPLKNWVGKEKIPMETITSSPHVFATTDGVLKEPEVLAMPKRHPSKSSKIEEAQDTSSLQSEKGSDDDLEVSDVELDFNRRVKGETAEEKRTRKAALKTQKRDRQQVKKMNKDNFRRVQLKPCKSATKSEGSIFID